MEEMKQETGKPMTVEERRFLVDRHTALVREREYVENELSLYARHEAVLSGTESLAGRAYALRRAQLACRRSALPDEIAAIEAIIRSLPFCKSCEGEGKFLSHLDDCNGHHTYLGCDTCGGTGRPQSVRDTKKVRILTLETVESQAA